MAPAVLAPSSTYQIIDRDPARVGRWLDAHGAGQYREGTTCIGLARHGELIAGTSYDYFNGASVFANIAIEGPITRQWLWFICYYPFVQLGVQTVLGLVAPNNVKSHTFLRRFGFTLLTDIPQGHPDGDLSLYFLHKDQCRFLRRPYGKV